MTMTPNTEIGLQILPLKFIQTKLVTQHANFSILKLIAND